MKLDFIGTSTVRDTIAHHLLEAGREVAIYNRVKTGTDPLVTEGTIWADTPKAVAEQNNIPFIMVGYPKNVEEIYYGQSGILSADILGHILADLITSTPSLTEKIAKTAKEEGAGALGAPAFDGNLGVKGGTLMTMVGGGEAVYDQIPPLFKESDTTLTLYGSTGKGQYAKMTNQIMITDMMTGMTEILVYTRGNGLDLKRVIETLSGGSAADWSLSSYSPHILEEDYISGLFVKRFIEDLKTALEEAEKMGLVLPATTQASKLYEELADKGFENDGIQALIRL